MRVIDEIFTACPFYGSRRIGRTLERDHNTPLCRSHVQRLMRLMGIVAIYPKKARNTSVANISHRIYPYLLAGVAAHHPNHIWGTDITYIRLENGWCYLAAIIDWYSRKVLSWTLSATIEEEFCVQTIEKALSFGHSPDIHNSDQGAQFTGEAYTSILLIHSIRVSMDGRGRCMDNIFTERLWRSVKYENVYLSSYASIEEAREGLAKYFHFYNSVRPHQALGYLTPDAVYEMQLIPSPIKGRNQKLAVVGS